MVSNLTGGRLALPTAAGVVVAAGGAAALVATAWDDAWHTDLGRDSAWIPPHLLLYGSMAVVGLVVAGWGVRVLLATRSVRAVLGHRALLTAGAGGAATLAAAPVDASWHASFGRDAVLWSPPHLVVIFASAALVAGVIAGLPPDSHRRSRWGPRWVAVALGGLLLGDLAASAIEYDTDVPQFSPVYYLPVLLAAALTAAGLGRRLVGGRLPVTGMVAAYVVVRLATSGVLVLLGRDGPVLPVAVVGLALADLPWRGRLARYAAAAAGVSVLAWVAAAVGLATEPPADVAVVAVPVVALAAVVVLAGLRSGRPTAAVLAVGLLAALPLLAARPAAAHDAGEGPPVRPVVLSGTSDGHGTLRLAARVGGSGCDRLAAVGVRARRAGRTVTAPLHGGPGCRFAGALRVPGGDRWFAYVELRDAAGRLEAWLPLPASRATVTTQHRELYRPAEAGPTRPAEIAAGAGLYLAGAALLAAAACLAAVAGPRPPGQPPR